MKKVFGAFLLLASIVLIGSSGVALAQGEECQDYKCNVTVSSGDGMEDTWTECVGICLYGNGFAEIGGDCWGCDLGGINLFGSNKTFVGECGSCWSSYVGSIVNLYGNSMTVDLFDEYGNMFQFRCVKSDMCEEPS